MGTLLKESSMLVSLTITSWTGRKYDKKATEEVNVAHGAKDAGRFNKRLVAADAIKSVTSLASLARTYHYEQTLAWDDLGRRLLPSVNYFEYVAGISEHKAKYEAAVNHFLSIYDSLRNDARKELNGLFNEKDYPSVGELRDKFSFVTKISTIEDSSDFRVAIDEEEQARIKEQIESNLQASLNAANEDIWDRVASQLRYIIERLSNPDNVFRDSLIGNVRTMVNLLPRLNFASDSKITSVCNDLRTLLVDTDMLRNNENARQSAVDNAKRILTAYGI